MVVVLYWLRKGGGIGKEGKGKKKKKKGRGKSDEAQVDLSWKKEKSRIGQVLLLLFVLPLLARGQNARTNGLLRLLYTSTRVAMHAERRYERRARRYELVFPPSRLMTSPPLLSFPSFLSISSRYKIEKELTYLSYSTLM